MWSYFIYACHSTFKGSCHFCLKHFFYSDTGWQQQQTRCVKQLVCVRMMCQVAPLSRHKVRVTIKVWPDKGNTSLCVCVCVCVNICVECVRECVKQRVFLKRAPKAVCVWVSSQAHCHGNTVNTVMTKQTQQIGQTGESTQTERALRDWICRCICAWWLLSQNQHHNTH